MYITARMKHFAALEVNRHPSEVPPYGGCLSLNEAILSLSLNKATPFDKASLSLSLSPSLSLARAHALSLDFAVAQVVLQAKTEPRLGLLQAKTSWLQDVSAERSSHCGPWHLLSGPRLSRRARVRFIRRAREKPLWVAMGPGSQRRVYEAIGAKTERLGSSAR